MSLAHGGTHGSLPLQLFPGSAAHPRAPLRHIVSWVSGGVFLPNTSCLHTTRCLQIAMVVMFLVSIILYWAVVAILLSSSSYFWFVSSVRGGQSHWACWACSPPSVLCVLLLPVGILHCQHHQLHGEPHLHPHALQDLYFPGSFPHLVGKLVRVLQAGR